MARNEIILRVWSNGTRHSRGRSGDETIANDNLAIPNRAKYEACHRRDFEPAHAAQ